MNWLDAIIVIWLISAVFRGLEIGLVQQLFSTAGFFGGLLFGTAIQPHTVNLAHTTLLRTMVTLCTTLGCGLLLMLAGEYAGISLKKRIRQLFIDKVDGGLGSLTSIVTVLITAWLGAAVISALPFNNLQTVAKNSYIIAALNKHLPAAPHVVADLGHLIDPNGFPKVFSGVEPIPRNTTLPDLGVFNDAVAKDHSSVVKIEGLGCGGTVQGSGFVAGPGLVVTNAHVIAGVKQPYVIDSNGQHSATPIWFDSKLDMAVVRVSNLAGSALNTNTNHIDTNSPAVVLGYPGGGPFNAAAAVVIDEITASGRDIYNRDTTERDVYELKARVIPGNSGGPLVAPDGSVIGVVFAQSTTYQNVGYALSTPQVVAELRQAEAMNRIVTTNSCAE